VDPRIITDQISDISRGMNVLWCVFYFISLSYNPPANGTRSLPLPRGCTGAGGWYVCVCVCTSCVLVRMAATAKGGASAEATATTRAGEMSNAKLRKHGSKIG